MAICRSPCLDVWKDVFLLGILALSGNWRRANVPFLNLIRFRYFEEVALLELPTWRHSISNWDFLGGENCKEKGGIYPAFRHVFYYPAFGHVHDCFCIFVDLIFGPIIHFLVGGL